MSLRAGYELGVCRGGAGRSPGVRGDEGEYPHVWCFSEEAKDHTPGRNRLGMRLVTNVP